MPSGSATIAMRAPCAVVRGREQHPTVRGDGGGGERVHVGGLGTVSAAYRQPPARNQGSADAIRIHAGAREEDLDAGVAAFEAAHRADLEHVPLHEREPQDVGVERAEGRLVATDEPGFEGHGRSP